MNKLLTLSLLIAGLVLPGLNIQAGILPSKHSLACLSLMYSSVAAAESAEDAAKNLGVCAAVHGALSTYAWLTEGKARNGQFSLPAAFMVGVTGDVINQVIKNGGRFKKLDVPFIKAGTRVLMTALMPFIFIGQGIKTFVNGSRNGIANGFRKVANASSAAANAVAVDPNTTRQSVQKKKKTSVQNSTPVVATTTSVSASNAPQSGNFFNWFTPSSPTTTTSAIPPMIDGTFPSADNI